MIHGLDKKKKKQNADMAEGIKDGQTGGATKYKSIDITISDPKTIGAETDLIKLTYDKRVDLSEIQKKFFAGLPEMNHVPPTGAGYDWTKLRGDLFDLFGVREQLDNRITLLPTFRDLLNELDPKIDWIKWLGTPIKNPIQQFDK